MIPILALITILAVGYLSAHFLIGKLQSKFFFTSGVEYIILGVLVGPQVTQVMTREVVTQLAPVMSLALGSIGLLAGLQLHVRDLFEVPPEHYRVAFLEMFVTFLLLGGAFALLFWYPLAGGLAGPDKLMAVFSGALVLATTGAVSAQTAIRVVEEHYRARGKLSDLLRFAGWFDALLGIALFGLIFCFFHLGQTGGIRPLTRTEWVAVNIVFGLLLGILFFLFLGGERSKQKLMLALLGIVTFSSGAAYYLNLSPLFINLVLGIMLANTSQISDRLLEVLRSFEKPLYVVLLVFAGAAWELPHNHRWYVFAGAATGYFLLRYLGKYLGGYLAYRTSEQPQSLARGVGLGLLSQGGVTVAMVINYQQVYQNQFTNLVVTCVLISVIINEFFSPKLMKDLLAGAKEIAPAR
jgi:Kef-type K+ transport system membrane component KefB